jgi:DNA mismatch repair protein MutS
MAKKKETITPIRRQYLDIKREYPDSILFFRLGDFYETFDEDALTTSKVLDIVLTSRNVAKGERVPMAGIPHHAMENYLGRLISQGYHVAICEQVSDKPVKGLMPRKVVRVVTPGTIVEEGLLPQDSNNFLACVITTENRVGVAYIDITTGEFSVTEMCGLDVQNLLKAELIRLNPAEILFSDDIQLPDGIPGHQTPWPSWRFELARCESILLEHFGVVSLDGFGVQGIPVVIRAAGGVVQYLEDTQPSSLKLISGLHRYSVSEFMILDSSTRRNLELTETIRTGEVEGSLLGVLDHTHTPMGRRLIRQWVGKPLLDVKKINDRLSGLSFFFEDGLLRAEFREGIRKFNDLERLTNRVVGGSAQPRDLIAILQTFERLPTLQALFSEKPEQLEGILSEMDLCSKEMISRHRTLSN